MGWNILIELLQSARTARTKSKWGVVSTATASEATTTNRATTNGEPQDPE